MREESGSEGIAMARATEEGVETVTWADGSCPGWAAMSSLRVDAFFEHTCTCKYQVVA